MALEQSFYLSTIRARQFFALLCRILSTIPGLCSIDVSIPHTKYDNNKCLKILLHVLFSSVHSFICVRLCDSMNRQGPGMPGLPVHHQLPEFTQTHAHRVGDAIQPSHPLSSPSPPAPNPSQHQGLFQ